MQDNDEWLTRPELAEWIKTPVGSLHQWAYRGTGPPYRRVGNKVLYLRSEVEAWLESNKIDPRERAL